MHQVLLFSLSLMLLAGISAIGPVEEPSGAVAAVEPGSGLAEAGPIELTFGVYTSQRASTMYRMLAPVLEELNESLSEDLEREVDIELRLAKTYEQGLAMLVEGEVDFVRFGPASYVLAKDQEPGIQLLAVEAKDGRMRTEGAVVVREDSGLQELQDLRGESFAFGDPSSTIGRYLVQSLLVDAELRAADFSAYAYLDRHDRVAAAVQRGDYAAGSIEADTLLDLEGDPLRVLARFEHVTKPWIARAGLSPTLVGSLTEALIELESKEALVRLGVTGFLPAKDADFAPTRSAMSRAILFERRGE